MSKFKDYLLQEATELIHTKLNEESGMIFKVMNLGELSKHELHNFKNLAARFKHTPRITNPYDRNSDYIVAIDNKQIIGMLQLGQLDEDDNIREIEYISIDSRYTNEKKKIITNLAKLAFQIAERDECGLHISEKYLGEVAIKMFKNKYPDVKVNV